MAVNANLECHARFIFVGVTERFTESVTLLEKLLPEFFSVRT